MKQIIPTRGGQTQRSRRNLGGGGLAEFRGGATGVLESSSSQRPQ